MFYSFTLMKLRNLRIKKTGFRAFKDIILHKHDMNTEPLPRDSGSSDFITRSKQTVEKDATVWKKPYPLPKSYIVVF